MLAVFSKKIQNKNSKNLKNRRKRDKCKVRSLYNKERKKIIQKQVSISLYFGTCVLNYAMNKKIKQQFTESQYIRIITILIGHTI